MRPYQDRAVTTWRPLVSIVLAENRRIERPAFDRPRVQTELGTISRYSPCFDVLIQNWRPPLIMFVGM